MSSPRHLTLISVFLLLVLSAIANVINLKETNTESLDIIAATANDTVRLPVLRRDVAATHDYFRVSCHPGYNIHGNTNIQNCGNDATPLWLTPNMCPQLCCCTATGELRCPSFYLCSQRTLFFNCHWTANCTCVNVPVGTRELGDGDLEDMLAEQEGDHTDEETKEQLEARIAKKCVGFGIGDADLEEANLTTSSNPVVNATAIDLGKPTPTTSFDPIVNNTPADVSLAPVLPRNITANETEDISMYPWRLVCNNRAGPNTHLWECGSATQHIWLTPFVCSQACCCNWDGFMRCPDYHNCEDYTLYFECAFTGNCTCINVPTKRGIGDGTVDEDGTDEEVKQQLEARAPKKCVGFPSLKADLEEPTATKSLAPTANASATDVKDPTSSSSLDPTVGTDLSLASILPRDITAEAKEQRAPEAPSKWVGAHGAAAAARSLDKRTPMESLDEVEDLATDARDLETPTPTTSLDVIDNDDEAPLGPILARNVTTNETVLVDAANKFKVICTPRDGWFSRLRDCAGSLPTDIPLYPLTCERLCCCTKQGLFRCQEYYSCEAAQVRSSCIIGGSCHCVSGVLKREIEDGDGGEELFVKRSGDGGYELLEGYDGDEMKELLEARATATGTCK